MPWKSPILKRAVYGVKSMFYKAKILLFRKSVVSSPQFHRKSVVFSPCFLGKVCFLFGYFVGKVYICTVKIIGKV